MNLRACWPVARLYEQSRSDYEAGRTTGTADLDGWRWITGIDLNILYTTRRVPRSVDSFLSPVSSPLYMCQSAVLPGSLWIITALHALHCMHRCLATRKLSVRTSICQTRGLWQNRRKFFPDYIQYKRSFILVFWQKEWLVGRPLLPVILGQTGPVGAKTPIFNRYSLVAPYP